MGPTGKLLKPYGDLEFEDAYEAYKEVVLIGKAAGADLVIIETMGDGYELKAAVLAAKENSDLPVFATVTLDEKGKMLTGGNVESVTALLEGLGADVIGLNCGLGPIQLLPFMKDMAKVSSSRSSSTQMRDCREARVERLFTISMPMSLPRRCRRWRETGRRYSAAAAERHRNTSLRQNLPAMIFLSVKLRTKTAR